MTSYPVIQDAVGETEFTRFVELHASPDGALYEADGGRSFPGDTVRITATTTAAGDDVVETRHTVEFLSLDRDDHWTVVGWIDHVVKEVDAMQGRHRLIESTLDVAGPGIPDGRFRRRRVEAAARAQFDGLRGARLLPLHAARVSAVS